MPTSSTFIITDNPSGNMNPTLSANGFDKSLNIDFSSNYAIVLKVNEDRSIVYKTLSNNLASTNLSFTGSLAYPYSNSIIKLPTEQEIVRIFNAPDGLGTSNSPAQAPPKVYYEPAPLLAWDDVNNNIVLTNRTNERLNKDKANLNTNVVSYKNTFNGF